MKINLVLVFAFICMVTFTPNLKANGVLSGKLPFINVSGGLLNYKGDLSKVSGIGKFHNPTFALEGSFGYVLWKTLGLELHLMTGTLSHEQNTSELLHNFKTTLIGGGLNVSFRFNNGFILSEDAKIAPFVFVGITTLAYWAQGDFLDAEGSKYYYWSDGSIRDIEEEVRTLQDPRVLERDYDYETSYRGINDDPPFALAYNVGVGFGFDVTKWLAAQMRVSYSFTNSDFLDGYKEEEGNDNFILGNFGFTVNPNTLLAVLKQDKEEENEDLDVSDFIALDTDGDGVPDLNDKCSGTPKGASVGVDGCAKDADQDKETDSLSIMADSLIVLRKNLCRDYPSLCGEGEEEYLAIDGRSERKIEVNKREKQEFPSDLPVDGILKKADMNGDGKLELPELYNAIELFFDGEADIKLSELRKLIDHFFDQY